MRLAILSDIHGNIIALDAVLKDIESQGSVDTYWILGDLVALGPSPVEVLERLSTLSNIHYIRGNTDRYVCTGDRPPPSIEEALKDPSQMTARVECANSFAWTQGMITQAGWFDWLSKLPLEVRANLPNGTRVLGVHSTPKRDDGLGIKAGFTEDELDLVLGDCKADLIFGGHHHVPLDTTVKGKRVINIGCIGNPVPPDLRASYILLEANSSGYRLELRRVDYECEAVIDALKRIHHPAQNWIINHYLGNYKSSGSEFIQKHLQKKGVLSQKR